jgi:hypothetical protein
MMGRASSTSSCSTVAAQRSEGRRSRRPCIASAAARACTRARSTARSAGTATGAPTADDPGRARAAGFAVVLFPR